MNRFHIQFRHHGLLDLQQIFGLGKFHFELIETFSQIPAFSEEILKNFWKILRKVFSRYCSEHFPEVL